MMHTGTDRVRAAARVTVEPLEGRQLFAAEWRQLFAAEYVYTGGGNPTAGVDPREVAAYPIGTPLTSFVGPLDLVEEYGGRKITLARRAAPLLALSASQLMFNDPVGGAISPLQKLTIRNTGTTPLTIPAGGLSINGTHAALFQILVSPTLPATIWPGGSLDLPVVFNPGASEILGVRSATLRVLSSDATPARVDVPLRGLATGGTGGANEPSLQRILDLYNIPVKTGDVGPVAANLYSSSEVLGPSDEIIAHRLLKAGVGPVTIETLAVFGDAATPTVTLGYYTPGPVPKKSDLLQVASAENPSVTPAVPGSVSFDPGSSAFSLYTVWPSFTNPGGTIRARFSEDALNTDENVYADGHKVRFFPLKDASGAIVSNAYVMAFQESVNNGSCSDGNQQYVAVIRNVKAAPAGPEPGSQPPDPLPPRYRTR